MRVLKNRFIFSLCLILIAVGFEIDETSRHTDSSFPDSDVMSPDSNHNDVPLLCHESATAAISANGRRIRNGSIEDDQQQAVMEAIEAIESIKVVNGRPHADDSFDNDSQDGRLSSQKYFSPNTPSSDLVIDEMSVDGQYNEQTDSPGMPEEAGTDNGKYRMTLLWVASLEEDFNF